jgi:GNAT superfamily N-acetyltransferase
MDINYILAREQQSISRAISSTSKSARAVHRSFAAAYGKLLGARGFPHREEQGPSHEPSATLDLGEGADLLTRDGVSLHVRPGVISDEVALVDFFNDVGIEDLRFRFGDTSHAIRSCVTLLAIGSDRTIVAASTLAGIAGTTTAEVALSVHALWKGRGIAWSLLEHSLAYAAKHGFEQVSCFERGDDRQAIDLEREMGFVARLISASPVELALTKNLVAE